MSSNLAKTIKDVLAVDRAAANNEISDERDVRQAVAPYQKEFPYERDEEGQVTRREFCNFLFLTSSALFLGAVGFAGKSAYDAGREPQFSPLQVEGANALQPGASLNFHYPKENDTIAVLSLLLSFASIVPFTIGALGCAACLGLGNGAVFKLVPQYFAEETGTVTGLVGAFGGLGGFFPPLELGIVKDATGSYAIGFVLLAVFAVICLAVNYFTFLRSAETDVSETSNAHA